MRPLDFVRIEPDRVSAEKSGGSVSQVGDGFSPMESNGVRALREEACSPPLWVVGILTFDRRISIAQAKDSATTARTPTIVNS
jgi:hypothetical protein